MKLTIKNRLFKISQFFWIRSLNPVLTIRYLNLMSWKKKKWEQNLPFNCFLNKVKIKLSLKMIKVKKTLQNNSIRTTWLTLIDYQRRNLSKRFVKFQRKNLKISLLKVRHSKYKWYELFSLECSSHKLSFKIHHLWILHLLYFSASVQIIFEVST